MAFLHIMSFRSAPANVSNVRLEAKYQLLGLQLKTIATMRERDPARRAAPAVKAAVTVPAGDGSGVLTVKAPVTEPAAVQLEGTAWLRFPAIDSMFTVTCHPDYYRGLRDECDAWTLSLFDPPLPPDDPRCLMYRQCLLSLLSCVFYPATASTQRMRLTVMLNNWFIILDNLMNQADIRTVLQLRCGLEAVLTSTHHSQLERAPNVADHLPPCCSHSDSTRVASFLKRLKDDVWDEMCKHMTPAFRARFAASLLDSVDAMHEATQLWRSTSCNSTPTSQYNHTTATMSLEDFMAIRERDLFIRPALHMSQFCLGIDVKNALLSQPTTPQYDLKQHIEDLERAVCKHVGWVNDIFSFTKELARNDKHSVVGFLLNKHAAVDNGPPQEQVLQTVVDEVWSMIQEQERIPALLLEEIQKKGSHLYAGHGREIVEYAQAMCMSMAGNMYWSSITGRYQGSSFIPWNTPIYMLTSIPLTPWHHTFTLNFLHNHDITSSP